MLWKFGQWLLPQSLSQTWSDNAPSRTLVSHHVHAALLFLPESPASRHFCVSRIALPAKDSPEAEAVLGNGKVPSRFPSQAGFCTGFSWGGSRDGFLLVLQSPPKVAELGFRRAASPARVMFLSRSSAARGRAQRTCLH